MRVKRIALSCTVALLLGGIPNARVQASSCPSATPAAERCDAKAAPLDLARRADELKNLKWGMFVCWSFSTFSGREWTPGVKDVSFFKATTVDTDQWARTAKEAGMGYILFLTKHHDGFCLWDTKTTDRKVTHAPLGRDVLADVRKSCDKYGIKLALYFSEGEFKDNKDYHPGGYTPEMKKAQLKELLTQYGPIEYIWFDHAQTDGGLSHEETTAWCHQCQPGTLIGYNSGKKSGEVRIGERGRPRPIDPKSGYLAAEFTYPILPDHKGGAQWFYSLPEHDHLCLSATALYRDYAAAVKHGNIFSVDVGPDYNGKLREIDVKTLREVGAMIKNPPPAPPMPVSQDKPATASSVWDKNYDASRAFDGDELTRWGAGKGTRSGWLEVDLGSETSIASVRIVEHFRRIQDFAIEYQQGDAWKALAHGTTAGDEKVIAFAPVSARRVRLNIFKASDTPTIEEFQIFASKN